MDKEALIGYCGFYCGSCPTFIAGQCGGCKQSQRTKCFTARCVTSKNLDYCGECAEFPCETILTKEKVTVLDKKWLAWKKDNRTAGN